MTIFTEGRHRGEYIATEANGTRSRDVATLASGNNLSAGTVLGKVTASSKYTILAPGASDGSQTAAGILFESTNASAADAAVVITARDTEVCADSLTWPAGITGPQKTAAITQLAALGILVR